MARKVANTRDDTTEDAQDPFPEQTGRQWEREEGGGNLIIRYASNNMHILQITSVLYRTYVHKKIIIIISSYRVKNR